MALWLIYRQPCSHWSHVIMGWMTSEITSITFFYSTVYSTVYSGAFKRKHQRSASLAFVGGIHRWPVNTPYKCPVPQKMFPFDDVIILALFFPNFPISVSNVLTFGEYMSFRYALGNWVTTVSLWQISFQPAQRHYISHDWFGANGF